MKKQAFYAKHKLTDAKPIDIMRRPIVAKDFADSVKDFLNSNFRGLIEVTHDVPVALFYVNISSDMAAYFMKLMLASANGEKMLKVNISTPEDCLVVTITSEGDLPFECDDANLLIRAARNAGFEIALEEHAFVLTTPLSLSKSLRVYAFSASNMYGKLNELFYTGGPIVRMK